MQARWLSRPLRPSWDRRPQPRCLAIILSKPRHNSKVLFVGRENSNFLLVSGHISRNHHTVFNSVWPLFTVWPCCAWKNMSHLLWLLPGTLLGLIIASTNSTCHHTLYCAAMHRWCVSFLSTIVSLWCFMCIYIIWTFCLHPLSASTVALDSVADF